MKGFFKNTMNTNDAQKAELQGINAALKIMKKTNVEAATMSFSNLFVNFDSTN